MKLKFLNEAKTNSILDEFSRVLGLQPRSDKSQNSKTEPQTPQDLASLATANKFDVEITFTEEQPVAQSPTN